MGFEIFTARSHFLITQLPECRCNECDQRCDDFLPYFFLGRGQVLVTVPNKELIETNGSLCETKEDSLRKAFKLRIEGKLKRNTEHRERMDQDLTKSLENQRK